MNELVSVIILTYNKFENLKETVDSLFIQDYKNIQVIVSDDGSKNFDHIYVNNLFKNCPNNISSVIILDNKNNQGTVKNFNNAIKKADGMIILPLSPDDKFMSYNTISIIQKYFNNNDCLICTGKRMIIDNDGNEVGILPSKEETEIFNQSPREIFRKIATSNIISGASTYYKKEVFEKFGYFDEDFKILEDHPYYLDHLGNGREIGFLNEVTLKYKLGGVSTSGLINPLFKDDVKKNFELKILNRKDILGKQLYRKLELSYYKNCFDNSTIKKIGLIIKYLDVVLSKIYHLDIKVIKKYFD